MSDALEAYISMILIRRFDFRCFDHFVQAFTRMPHTSFSNSTVHAFRCHQGPEVRSALHAIVAEGLQSAENTVGGRRTFFEYEATTIWDSYLGLSTFIRLHG